MAAWYWINYACITLCITAIFSHTIGLLLFLKANTRTRVHENIEIASISISTVLICLIYITRLLLPVVPQHVMYVAVVSICIPFYCAMILLTLQRFFAIYMHLRYRASIVYTKRQYAVGVTWIVGVILFAACTSLYLMLGMNFSVLMMVITSSGLFLTFIVFIFVYAYIYTKFRKASGEAKLALYTKSRSKIFLPFIICGSFFMLGMVPHFFQDAVKDMRYVIIWFCLDSICNSVVYLFLNPVLLARFRRWKSRIGKQGQ